MPTSRTGLLRSSFLLLVAACGGRTGLGSFAVDVIDASPLDAGVAGEVATPTGPGVGARCPGCQGCCDGAGACQPGDTEAACGIGGRACEVCASRDICDTKNLNGPSCVNPCSDRCPLRCCLRDGSCKSGIADDACGNDGSLCHDCTTSGQVCKLASGGGGVCQAQ
jgi:hypothetical protein